MLMVNICELIIINLLATGLRYDREWVIKSASGEMLTQKKCPRMCFIQTHIDLQLGLLRVHALHMKDELILPLTEVAVSQSSESISRRSCGLNRLKFEVQSNEWFTQALGVSCTLVRRKSAEHSRTGHTTNAKGYKVSAAGEDNGRSFANEAQFLLVSQASVDDLNWRLSSSTNRENGLNKASSSGRARLKVNAVRFRPNLVVSGSAPYDEDNWQSIFIGDQRFQVVSGCNRCNMINVDQVTGQFPASGEPLVTLASYRRVKGKIFFGVLLEQERTLPASHVQYKGKEMESALKQASMMDNDLDVSGKKVGTEVLEVGQRLYITRSTDNACLRSIDGKSCIHSVKRT